MLSKIRCSRFRAGEITFHSGLNVILGDAAASNSIGKSTLLLIIDFAFGGSTLTQLAKELVKRLGEHEYEIWFKFGDSEFGFVRNVKEAKTVERLVTDGRTREKWPIARYTDWLRAQYALRGEHISFRSAVSPYSRIWLRESLDVDKPLHAAQRQSDGAAIDGLLQVYERFDPIASEIDVLNALKGRKRTASNVDKIGFGPPIGAREFRRNRVEIGSSTEELAEIRNELRSFAANIAQVLNRDVLERKKQKDGLLREELQIRSRLQRIERDLEGLRALGRKSFEQLLEYFPTVNIERLETVEGFHHGISTILRSELQTAKRELATALSAVQGQIEGVDQEIREKLSNIDNPGHIVDRIVTVSNDVQRRKFANELYTLRRDLAAEVKQKRQDVARLREQQTTDLGALVNNELVNQAAEVSPGRRSPALRLSAESYEYEVDGDTGTGTAYAALVLFDLVVLRTSQLPFVVHDSLLFKNVEVVTMKRLLEQYTGIKKQTFIAIDETQRYGPETASVLSNCAVVKLNTESLLFDVDWRKR